ncbi:MAG: TetR/AcrR family transcriptional regulator [Dehalococcoidia bacterium]|jgi:AcrR family transcriptional regulator
MPRRSKKNDQNIHDNILIIAEKLLLNYGIKGWNMDSVAKEAGIAKNTLYEIISSKEQLIEDVVISRLKNNVEVVVEIFKNEPDFEKACNLGSKHLARAISTYDLLILPQVFREYPMIKEKFGSIGQKLGTSIHNYINKAKKDGKVRKEVDNDVLINCVTAIVNYLLSENYMGKDYENRVNKGLSYLLKGILT